MALLLTEDDIRQYFIDQGGICRNNELVTYFRAFLSNPSNREEARALFKSYVNKLATMKVENGEKFLVLKRQFYPMEESGLPSAPSTMGLGQGYENPMPSTSSGLSQHNQYPYQGPPPYVPAGGFPSLSSQPSLMSYFPQLQQQQSQMPMPTSSHFSPPMQELPSHMSKSQPSLYGSHFSLNSNASSYVDPQMQHSSSANFGMYPSQGHNAGSSAQSPGMGVVDYPLQYGLPPPPSAAQTVFPPRRLSFSSPPSNFGNNSPTTSASRLPPPYRPPPPAYIGSPPPPAAAAMSGKSPVILRHPPPPSADNFGLPGPSEITGRSHYRRSLSATGLSVSGLPGLPKTNPQPITCSSAGENLVPFFSATGTPPPPVPPRAKRQSSFLEKSPNFDSGASSTSRKLHMEELNKENSNPVEGREEEGEGHSGVNGTSDNGSGSAEATENENLELEQKISVRERMQKFNRAGEGELPLVPKQPNGNAKGRKDLVSKLAQPIRFLLAYLKIEFEEKRYTTQEEWLADKNNLGLDFPNLPYLIHGDIKLTESRAILKYFAREKKPILVWPQTFYDTRRGDMLENVITDTWAVLIRTCMTYTDELRESLDKTMPLRFEQIVKFFRKNKFALSNNITYVDFLLYEMLYHYTAYQPDCLAAYPRLLDYKETFEDIMEIEDYIASPEYIKGPCINPAAKFPI